MKNKEGYRDPTATLAINTEYIPRRKKATPPVRTQCKKSAPSVETQQVKPKSKQKIVYYSTPAYVAK